MIIAGELAEIVGGRVLAAGKVPHPGKASLCTMLAGSDNVFCVIRTPSRNHVPKSDSPRKGGGYIITGTSYNNFSFLTYNL